MSEKQKAQLEKIKGHRWKPGESGNPSGRPKSGLLSAAYRELLREIVKSGDASQAEVIARAIAKRAGKGDVRAASEIADRTEGKPAVAVRVSGEDGGPIRVVVDL